MKKKKRPACNKKRSVSVFGKNLGTSDGLSPKCKPCSRVIWKVKYRKISFKNIERRRRKLAPIRIRATRFVQYRVAAGLMKREPCFLCGSVKNIEAHHIDYDFSDKVFWLCRDHHRKFHLNWKDASK